MNVAGDEESVKCGTGRSPLDDRAGVLPSNAPGTHRIKKTPRTGRSVRGVDGVTVQLLRAFASGAGPNDRTGLRYDVAAPRYAAPIFF
jgi:hypothetical protein